VPNFRFYIEDSAEIASNPIDVDLANATEARTESIKLLAAIAHDVLPDGNRHDFAVRVNDASDVPLFEATLSLRARWLTEDARVTGENVQPELKHGFL
jgi:hypothetical protein